MDSNELRRACEMAGLWLENPSGVLESANGNGICLPLNHPALPAYVASLLVAKVMLTDRWCRKGFSVALARLCDPLNTSIPYGGVAFATNEQRIRAAMEVLSNEPNSFAVI